MTLPPVDLVFLRDQFTDLAERVNELWEPTGTTAGNSDSPTLLRDAMLQLVDMLHTIERGDREPAELNTLGEYGLHLIDELAAMARQVEQSGLAGDIETLALPLALWVARRNGEIRNLAAIVGAVGRLANQAGQARAMAMLYTHCCELIEATSPACEEIRLGDGRHPWRLLLLNRAVIATRSQNPELMTAAFDAIVDNLPDEAQRFFAEGMEQMTIGDYPDAVREVVKRYYLANSAPRRLH